MLPALPLLPVGLTALGRWHCGQEKGHSFSPRYAKARGAQDGLGSPGNGHCHPGCCALSPGLWGMADRAPRARGLLLKATQPGAQGPWGNVTKVLLQPLTALGSKSLPRGQVSWATRRVLVSELTFTRHGGHVQRGHGPTRSSPGGDTGPGRGLPLRQEKS